MPRRETKKPTGSRLPTVRYTWSCACTGQRKLRRPFFHRAMERGNRQRCKSHHESQLPQHLAKVPSRSYAKTSALNSCQFLSQLLLTHLTCFCPRIHRSGLPNSGLGYESWPGFAVLVSSCFQLESL